MAKRRRAHGWVAVIHKRKLLAVAAVFYLVIGSAMILLSAELYLVVQRKLASDAADDYASKNIYSGTVAYEAFADPLWDKPFNSYKPHAELMMPVGEETYHVKINSHGFRCREFIKENPGHVYRIICIGGSTTVQGKTNDLTYPAILEKILQKRYPGRTIEVLNFGIGGTQSGYWLSRLDHLFGFKPDMIVQYNAVNDICWNYLMPNRTCSSINMSVRKRLNTSFLFQKLFPIDPPAFDDCFKNTLDNFNALAVEARKRHVAYIAGSFGAPDYSAAVKPFRDYLDCNVQNVWGVPMKLKYYSGYFDLISRYNRLFKTYAKEKGLHAALVDEHVSDPAVYKDICHMTPDGLTLMAETFSLKIIEVMEAEQVFLTNTLFDAQQNK